VAVEAVQ